MKKSILTIALLGTLGATPAMAKKLSVSVTNLTNAIYFTPIVAAAHDQTASIYELGTPASSNLQALAEGGDFSGVSADLQAQGGNVIENPAGGLLAPGSSTTFSMKTNGNNQYFSLAGMLIPTNDGFVGANAIHIPSKKGTYTYFLNGYDAGTEANNEVINGGGAPGVLGIPADPGGNSGINATGVTVTEENTNVHVHRGIIGDSDLNGGKSDLTTSVHRWLNPVAKLVITVK